MANYTHTNQDPWQWSRPIHTDVEAILELVDQNYSREIDPIFTPNRSRMAYHLHRAILGQTYATQEDFLSVAKQGQQTIAWAWLTRGKYQVYADEEMAVGEFIHVDLNLSPRQRIRLVAQILEQWIAYCELMRIPVLTSTSIRAEQTAFMRLHSQFGFSVRGSFAYRRIDSI